VQAIVNPVRAANEHRIRAIRPGRYALASAARAVLRDNVGPLHQRSGADVNARAISSTSERSIVGEVSSDTSRVRCVSVR
jgi:hypothetical protein